MATLRISTGEVRGIGKEIVELSQELYNILNDIRTKMRDTDSRWDSPAAREIRTNFESAANEFFNKHRGILEDYGKFLQITVSQSYEELDQQLKSNAEQFRV